MNEGYIVFCTGPAWRRMLEEEILPAVLDPVDLGGRVVEVGPGAGFTTEVLRRSAAHVTAVEIDPELAARLRARLGGAGVDVVHGDARRTGLPDASFTGAASFHMLHHVPTDTGQDEIFAELRRLLGPGGRLAMADGVDREGVREFHEGDTYHPVDPDGLPERLERAGFVDVRVGRHEIGWCCWAAVPG